LREMPLTVLVDREDQIAISHAGVVDPLVFEADIKRAPRRIGERSAYFAHRCEFVPICRHRDANPERRVRSRSAVWAFFVK
jgi:hypothetical protein